MVKKAGQIVLIRFPGTGLQATKLRPALVLNKVPGKYADWLICMISTQIHQNIEGFDEIIHSMSKDFAQSGLKKESIIRLARLAVVSEDLILGAIDEISDRRLKRIKAKIAKWIKSEL